MSLEITEVRIQKNTESSKIKAYAKVTFNNAICVTGIKIVEGEKGTFIGMPSRKTKENEYRDIVFPINQETRKILTEAIMKAYGEQSDNDPF